MKKAISILLVIVLMMSMAASGLADRIPAADRGIRFGRISVQSAASDWPMDLRGARDDERGIVYIHAYDLMDALGAEIIREGEGENCILHYWVGNWHAAVNTESGSCEVTYRLMSAYEGETDIPYGRYELADCLYVPEKDVFYLPFEQMMYMFAATWMCEGGTVKILQPETFLDVLCGFDGLYNEIPVYEQLMGEKAWQQLMSSFGFGVGASIDEVDMAFLWDGVASIFTNTSGYQQKATENAVMLLLMDTLAEEGPLSGMYAGSEGLEKMSAFTESAGALIDATVVGELYEAEQIQNLAKLLGKTIDGELLEAVNTYLKPGVSVLSYALEAAQVYWLRSMLDDNLAGRIEFLQKAAAKRAEEEDYFRDLQNVSTKILAEYFESEAYKQMKAFSFSELMSTLDGTMTFLDGVIGAAGSTTQQLTVNGGLAPNSAAEALIVNTASRIASKVSGGAAGFVMGAGNALGFGSYILGMMNFTVSTFDLIVETVKLAVPEGFNAAEDAHTCLNLIYISNMLKKEFVQAYDELKTGVFTHETLENARMSVQLLTTASMHAHEILAGLGKWEVPEDGYREPAYIVRLLNSIPFDPLLMMDEGYVNLVSDEPGCVRHDIPVSYVRLSGKVVITTESYADSGEHFSARIVRPHVWAEANPDLTAMIDAELDKLYTEKYGRLEERKNGAASCKSDMQTHTETLTLTSAYSNGGFVSFSLQSGYFMCTVGHDCNETFAYIFDVASGEKLEFENLLDLENNPQAKDAFIAMIGRELESKGYSDSKAGKIYSEMLKDEVARWDITPQGIKVLIDVMYFDLFGCGTMIMPYEELNGILKEEYLPQESVGQMCVTIEAYDAAAVGEDEVVYGNEPQEGMLTLMGAADHVWVGSRRQEVDGSCSTFYAYAPGNSRVTIPGVSARVAWIDETGEYVQDLRIKD